MPLRNIYRWFHPEHKELDIPHWARLGSVLAALILGQFLVYRNSARNLAVVIEEKRYFSTQINALTAELGEEKQKNAALIDKIPKETSLKIQALQAANQLERFFQRRAKHQPSCTQTSTMTPEEQRAAIEPCTKYNFETMIEYSERFAPQIMAMVEQFRAKGMSVRDIENCVPQGWCGIAISVQLRAFAARLDAKDNVKR